MMMCRDINIQSKRDICQPFFSKILEAFTQADIPKASLYYPTHATRICSGVDLISVVDNQAYRKVSFDGRQHDVVSYEARYDAQDPWQLLLSAM